MSEDIYDLKFKRENGRMILLGENAMTNNNDGTWSIAEPETMQTMGRKKQLNLFLFFIAWLLVEGIILITN